MKREIVKLCSQRVAVEAQRIEVDGNAAVTDDDVADDSVVRVMDRLRQRHGTGADGRIDSRRPFDQPCGIARGDDAEIWH